MIRSLPFWSFVVACGGKDGTTPVDDAAADEGDADTDADTDADADADTDSDADTDTGTAPTGVAVLGGLTHDLANVVVTEVLTADDGLSTPSDLEFHPDVAGELWITNRQNDSMVIVSDAGGAGQVASLRRDPVSGNHFLARPSSLAFGDNGLMATIHEEDEPTQGAATPGDFMGPTLWTSDATEFDGGDDSHYDMLHNSPNGVGIAWETGNVYWVFDGFHRSLTRYDFVDDHGAAGVDHSDGVIQRFVEDEVSYLPGVVSHLAYDAASRLLYVADSGNARIAVLDTTTGTEGDLFGPAYDGTGDQHLWDGAVLTTLVDGAAIGLEVPAGLELHDGLLYVSDANTATIWAFDLLGNTVDWLPLGRAAGGVQGIEIDSDGDLWVADLLTNTVLQITPP